MKFRVKVIPNARTTLVETDEKGNLRVKLSSVPEKGKANEELINVLAKHYNVKKSGVRILKGLLSKEKLVEVDL